MWQSTITDWHPAEPAAAYTSKEPLLFCPVSLVPWNRSLTNRSQWVYLSNSAMPYTQQPWRFDYWLPENDVDTGVPEAGNFQWLVLPTLHAQVPIVNMFNHIIIDLEDPAHLSKPGQ